MNEVYFLGMDIIEETKTIVNFSELVCTNGMSDNELKAYKMGVANALSALNAVLEVDDSNACALHMSGLEVATEFTLDEIESYLNN